MRKLWRLVAVLALFALIAGACGDDDDSGADGADGADGVAADSSDEGTDDGADGADDVAADSTDEATDGEAPPAGDDVCTEDKVGGEITVSPRGSTVTLDTFTNGGSNILTSWEGIVTHTPLVYFDADAVEYVPLAAESLTPNDDNTVWTLKLRPDVVFGNGDPLNAEAVVAHFDRHLGPESVSRLRTNAGVYMQSWTAVDDLTVEVTLFGPFGAFPSLLTVGLGQVDNVALIEERGADAYALDNTGGGVGPYEVTEFSPGERTVLTAKSDWWGGPVCIEKITVNNIPDMRAAYDAYRQDEIDILSLNRDPVLLNEVVSDALGSTATSVNNNAFMVMPNVGTGAYDGPLTDIRVRQALAYAIDTEVINARAWGGEGIGGKGIVSDQATLLTPTEGIAYDPAKATELLDEYKAETGWDGTVDAISAGQPSANKEAAIAVAAMLDAVGFKVNLSAELPVNDLVTKVFFEKNFEIVASWGIINSETTLGAGLRSWFSTNPGNQNGFMSEAYDAAIMAMDASTTTAEYQAAMDQLQTVVNEEIPFVTYGADPTTTLYRDTIKGLIWHDTITPMMNFAYIG